MKSNFYLLTLLILLGVNGLSTSPCDSITSSYFTTSISGNTVTLNGFKSNSLLNSYYGMGGAGNFTSGNSGTANAIFVYDNPGTYTVDWTVWYTDSGNYCADTIYQTITVGDSCEADFTYTVSGNTITVINLSNRSYTEVYWQFGDTGSWTQANGDTVIYTYSQSGTYWVNMGLYGDSLPYGCDSAIKIVNVGGNPCDSISASYFTASVSGNTLTLTGFKSNPALSSYYGMGGTGNFTSGTSNTANATFVYDNPGTYIIDWTVSYWDSNTYCADTMYQTITIGNGLTSPCDSISASYFTASVSGNTVTLTGFKSNPALSSYYGMGGTGSFTSGTSNTANATFVYDNPGTYTIDWTVSYWDSNTYCADTMYQTITIGNGNLDSSVCDSIQNGGVDYMVTVSGNQVTIDGWKPGLATQSNWTMGGTGTYLSGSSSSEDVVYLFDNPGTYTISWYVEYTSNNALLCSDTVDKIVVVGDSLSGIADKYKDIRLTTYPNPFDNEFTINMNLDKEVIIDLKLLNSIGQVLYAEELNSFDLQNRTISTPDLESGVYMLMLRDKENDQIIKTQRLVKK